MTDSRTSPWLQIATFICWPAASSSTEHRAVISSVPISASPRKPPYQKGVRFALIRAILLRKTPTGAKKMGSPDSSPITRLLLRWGAGEEECHNELVPLVQRTALVRSEEHTSELQSL